MTKDLPEFVARMKAGVEHIVAARDIFSRGPLDFYLQTLVEHSEALLTRFSPIKIGQRAVIVGHIECRDGWTGRERTLAVGALGQVVEVFFRNGKFRFEFLPDHDWWKGTDGEFRKCDIPGTYCLSEDVLLGLREEWVPVTGGGEK